jgi:hypothetical protein
MKQKGGFGHDNYRKHAPFFGRKSIIFAKTFGFGLYFGYFYVFFAPTFGLIIWNEAIRNNLEL